MYLTHVKTAVTQAMRASFGATPPDPDFENLYISIEYPVDRQNYPSIWVDFDPDGNLEPVGIGQIEQSDPSDATSPLVYRWRFTGTATFTIASMTSLERDRLFDCVVKVLAFGDSAENMNEFRTYIEGNSLIAMDMNWDKIEQRGFAAGLGTPWGTEEIIYEATLAMGVLGEFTVNSTGALVPLSEVVVVDWVQDVESDPYPNGNWIG